MPQITMPSHENENVQRAVSALAAAATTYLAPARFPKWVRRGISMSNTLASVGMAVAGDRRPARAKLAQSPNDTVEVVGGKPVSRASMNIGSAASAGVALVSSGIALRVDRTVEKMLIKRGVRNPRLWMAAGAAVISLAGPWVTKQIQASTAKLQEKSLPKTTLESTLADPLGTDKQHNDVVTAPAQIDAGDPSRVVAEEKESSEQNDHSNG